MYDEEERRTIIDFLGEVIRYYKSVNRNIKFYQTMYGVDKKINSANTRIEKKIVKLANELNVEFLEFSGSDYSVELPVDVLNLDDFSENDKLIILDTIEPTIKEKNSSNIIKNGKVTVNKK